MAGPEETKPGSEARQPVLACATEQLARAQPASSRHPARAPRAIALCSTIVSPCWLAVGGGDTREKGHTC